MTFAGRAWSWAVIIVLVLIGTGACSSGSSRKPQTTARQARPEAPVQPATPEPAPAPVPAAGDAAEGSESPEPVTGAYGPRTVVIDDPEPEETETQSLLDAARRAREARAKEGEPIAVITDETLSEYATGELSVAEEKSLASSPDEESAESGAETETEEVVEERGETYWRERVRGARMRWRDLVEEITRLEGEVAGLRRQFYAEDDGFYRDSQIKPAWDRALDRLAETRTEVSRAQENLTTILEEGRMAGALPGWLREGIEYEPPKDEPDDGPDIHEATEPQVIEQDGEIDDGR